MNWDAIGAVGEILGAVAVLATLIYLARQIQQNTAEVRSSNYHSITDSFNTLNLALAENTELGEIFRKGDASYTALSEDEKFKYDHLMYSIFRVWDVLYYQYVHGTGDERLWEFERRSMERVFETPGRRDWWRNRPYSFSDELVDYVETELMAKYDTAT